MSVEATATPEMANEDGFCEPGIENPGRTA